MKTPKQRFLELPLSKSFLQTSVAPDLEAALDYALLQLIADLPTVSEGNNAAANAYRIDGARRFIATLTTLPVVLPSNRPPANRDNLEP